MIEGTKLIYCLELLVSVIDTVTNRKISSNTLYCGHPVPIANVTHVSIWFPQRVTTNRAVNNVKCNIV